MNLFYRIYHSVQIQIPAAQEITGATSSAQFHLSIISFQNKRYPSPDFKQMFQILVPCMYVVRFHVSSKIRALLLSSLKNEAFALCYYITQNTQKNVYKFVYIFVRQCNE